MYTFTIDWKQTAKNAASFAFQVTAFAVVALAFGLWVKGVIINANVGSSIAVIQSIPENCSIVPGGDV